MADTDMVLEREQQDRTRYQVEGECPGLSVRRGSYLRRHEHSFSDKYSNIQSSFQNQVGVIPTR